MISGAEAAVSRFVPLKRSQKFKSKLNLEKNVVILKSKNFQAHLGISKIQHFQNSILFPSSSWEFKIAWFQLSYPASTRRNRLLLFLRPSSWFCFFSIFENSIIYHFWKSVFYITSEIWKSRESRRFLVARWRPTDLNILHMSSSSSSRRCASFVPSFMKFIEFLNIKMETGGDVIVLEGFREFDLSVGNDVGFSQDLRDGLHPGSTKTKTIVSTNH